MTKEHINQTRKELNQFLCGREKTFDFTVECNIQNRIKTIYQILFPGFKRIKFYCNFFIARVAQYTDYSPFKVFLYRLIGVRIGKGIFISPDVLIDPHFPSCIKLDDYCILGWGTKLFTHEFADSKYRIGRIEVQEGAIVSGGVTIRNGVTIGKMSEIPYGSIVSKDVEPNTKARQVLIRQVKNEG